MNGELALITGGGSGIGLGIAQALVESGYRVLLAGRRAEILAEAAVALGEQASWISYDVDRFDEADEFIAECERRHGPIAALVNNAGAHHKAASVTHSLDSFVSILTTNLVGVFALTQAAGKRMIERRNGAIVMVSSITALVGLPEVAAYASSKAALLGLMRTLAIEWSAANVRVNAICPGFVETDIFKRVASVDAPRIEKILNRIPAKRTGSTLEIGRVVAFLCSSQASYVSGATMTVDGGYSIGF